MNKDDPLRPTIHNPLNVDMQPGLAQINRIRGLAAHAQLKAFLWMLGGLRVGSLTVKIPGDGPKGSVHEFKGTEPGPHGELIIHRASVIRKSLLGASTGFGEAYVDGDWDSPCLAETLEVMLRNEPHYKGPYDKPVTAGAARLLGRGLHALRHNNRANARKNIQAHYDLGNDFYARWLDETMAYSSAVFTPDTQGSLAAQPLADAQRSKFARMLERLELTAEHHLLEIGSGWGGFAIYAAQQTSCRVTSITLSDEQLAWAKRAAQDAGVADRVSFELCDYRDVTERYDRVASIEMCEAVGEAYWPTYFDTIARVLKPGGVAAIQGITIDDEKFKAYRAQIDFIQKYIFPGGMLASVSAFGNVAQRAGLAVEKPLFFGKHYAETLRRWDVAVREHADAIVQQYGARFLRMWRYYLAYCECGFEHGQIDLMQVTLRKA